MVNKKSIVIACILVVLCAINMQTPPLSIEEIKKSDLVQEQFKSIMQSTKQILDADIVSVEVLQKNIQNNLLVERMGTPEQQRAVRTMMRTHRTRFMHHISTVIDTLLYDSEVRALIKRVTLAAFTGAIPYLLLTGLKMSTGQTSYNDMIIAEDAAIYGATLQMISELTQLLPGSEPKDVMLAKGIDLIKGDASWWVVPIAGGLSAMTKELGIMVTESIERKGGAATIIQHIDWKNVVLGEPLNQVSNKYRAPVDYLMNQFTFIIKNKKTRDVLGTVLLTAAEGALIGLLLWYLGVWFIAEETALLAMQNAAIRGAIQGFINYIAGRKTAPGMLQNISGGFMSRYIQRLLMLQQPELSLIDTAPVVLKEITVTAVQSTVNQLGGWPEAIDTITHEAKVSGESRWGWLGRAVKSKVTNTIDRIHKDLVRGFEQGVL